MPIVDPFQNQQADQAAPSEKSQGASGIVDPFQNQESPATPAAPRMSKTEATMELAKKLPGIAKEVGSATAVDLIDMVLGIPGMIATTLETGALDIVGLAHGDRDAAKHANAIMAEQMAKPANAASVAPVRGAMDALGKPVGQSPIGYALGKAQAGVEARGQDVAQATDTPAIAEVTPQLLNAGMSLLAAHAVGRTKVRTNAVQESIKAGVSTEDITDMVLQNAAKKGIDTSAVTKGQIKATLDDIAAYYGTGVEHRTGERATHSQLDGLTEKPKLPADAPTMMPTDKLVQMLDKNRRLEPKDTIYSPGGLEDTKASIAKDGFDKARPITVTVSKPDNMALVTDGNTRTLANHELKNAQTPTRFEKTEVPFTEEQKARAKPLDTLGITQDMIPDKVKSAKQLADQAELRALLGKDATADTLITPLDNNQGLVGVKGTHFSQAQRELLTGKMFGTGAKGEEAYRLKMATDPRILQRISFYVDEGKGVFPERGVGAYRHDVPLNNLYDASKNPLKLPTESFMYGDTAGPDFNRFESSVIDAGFDGYYMKGAFGRQGAAVLLGEAAQEVRVPTKGGESYVNIGLHTNDGVGITTTQIEAVLRDLNISVEKAGVHQSNTEPTYSAKLSRPLTPEEANKVSVLLKQEAVAQTHNGHGNLYGPKAKEWGPFNSEYFIMPDGKKLNPNLLGQAFKQRGAIGIIYEPTLERAMERASQREGEVGKKTARGYQVTVPMDLAEAEKLPQSDQINMTQSAAELYKSNYFKKQVGVVDKQLIANAGLMLGGATLGVALAPSGEKTQGLLLGAAIGFGLANLPRATAAITNNWKGAVKTTALGAAYAGVGYMVDKDNPVEGVLVGSAIFGLRFLPKTKVHPEDELINARNGNIAAEKRLISQVRRAMETAIPDKAAREVLAVKAEDPKYVGTTAEEKAVIAAHRGLTRSYYEMAVNADVKMGFIEGYVSHIIERGGLPQSEVAKVMTELFGMPQAGVGGRAKFTKERAYPSFESLEKALDGTSLKLKTKDLAEIDQIYSETMSRTIENQQLINNLKEATLGDAEGRSANLMLTEAQPGYVKLPNPQLLPYYVHPDIAPALKFVFDSRNHNDLTNGLITLNRATKRLNVIGSFFHAKSLLEAYALAGGSLTSAKGAIDSAIKLLNEGGLGDEVDKGMRAGLRIEMPTEVSKQAVESAGHLADHYVSRMLGKEVNLAGKIGGGLERVQEKTFDKFTWDYLHVGLKTATYLRLMEDFKLGKKGKGMSEDTYRQGVASHINDTFGGLDWYRVVSEAKTEAGRKLAMSALKPSSRDMLGIAIFAPDWTLSTIRAMSKALPGGSKNPANALLAKQYALRTAVLYATAMTGINYALSGHFPWENKDPTRIDLGDGTSLQVVKHSMEFAEWVRDPWKTFSNKMGFIPRSIEALRYGKQFPGGPPIENKLGYMSAQVAPFTARSFQGEIDPATSAARALLGMFGISVYGMTDAEKAKTREARKERAAAKGIKDPYKGY
jgi:hypothetical protein